MKAMSHAERKTIRQLAGKMSARKIAEQLGRPKNTISHFCWRNSISLRVSKSSITAEDRNLITQLRATGMTLRELAEKFETSISTIWKACN